MRVLIGEAPRLVHDLVVMRHHAAALVLLVPHGMHMLEAAARFIRLASPGERDEVRMALGAPPVGADPRIVGFDGVDRWCLHHVPEALRLEPPTCGCDVSVSTRASLTRSPDGPAPVHPA